MKDMVPVSEKSAAAISAQKLRGLLRATRATTWDAAVILHAVYFEAQWRDGYVSFADWLEKEKIPLSRGTISKLLGAVTAVRGLPGTERQRWVGATQPTMVYKVRQLIPKHRAIAYDLASSEASEARVAEVLAEKLPDHHLEPGIRRLTHMVKPATRALWNQVLSLIRVHLGTQGMAHPSDDEVISAIAQTVLLAPELTHMDEERLGAVLAGDVYCVLCGSYAQLEQHHVVPRSHGATDAEGAERVCWLCAGCHHDVTENRTPWRLLAAHLDVTVPE